METIAGLAGNLGIFFSYYAGSCLRYFVVAGLLYCFFHVWFSREWMAYRIQKTFPKREQVAHEIRWSLYSMACSGVLGVLLYRLVHAGWTRMYFDVGLHGGAYFALSIAVGVVGYDTWFYWQHRLLHTPWWFVRAHRVHHHASNPTPFANFAHHPLEITLGNVYFVLLLVFVPLHPVAYGLVSMLIFGWGMIGHLGYEFYPRSFADRRAFRWLNTATHHNMHHSQVGCNYSAFFNWWDRLMGTNHPAYRATYRAVRNAPAAETAVRVAVGA